ncbi:MAG: SDR family NAD(P)-dependent oxidoreductase, partial [Acidobacteriota bacterium]
MTRDPLWLDGLDVLITGGSSGIGRAIARRCVETGAHVHLVARDATRLVDAQRELLRACVRPRQEVTWSACDVTSAEAVEVLFARLQQIGFVSELVVNSAGIGMPGTYSSLSLDDYERAMQVHYVGTLRILDRVIPGMVERGRGDILNIGSIAALLGVYGLSAYCASKFAIRGFTESLRYELKPHGVSVSLLCPPDTETPHAGGRGHARASCHRRLDGARRLDVGRSSGACRSRGPSAPPASDHSGTGRQS